MALHFGDGTNPTTCIGSTAGVPKGLPPCTIATWVKFDQVSTVNYHFAVFDPTVTYGLAFANASGTEYMVSNHGSQAAATVDSLVAGRWYFCVGRAIGETDTRIDVLDSATGVVTSAQDTTDVGSSTTATELICIGGIPDGGGGFTPYFTGATAEAWYADCDIAPAGGAASIELMHQLAYGGPFSVPRIAPYVRFYKSLRSTWVNKMTESFSVENTVWTPTGGNPDLHPHPPLPYWYRRPSGLITRPSLI